MNKRQHKKNFINKIYGLSLNNDYVVLNFDKNKIRPKELNDWAKCIDKRANGKIIIIPNEIQIEIMEINDMKYIRDFLDKRIEKLEA